VRLSELLDEVPEVAVIVAGATTSRDALSARADEIAAELRAIGVQPNQAVAVQLPNGWELIAALFGVWRAGCVYLPCNPRSPHAELEATLSQLRPAAHIDSDGLRALADPLTHDERVALLQLTSGTTGPPKPVPLEHATVIDMLDRVVRSIRSKPAADPAKPPMPNLVPVSLSLWAGIYQVLFAFRVGAPVVLMDRFEPKEFAALVRAHGIRSTVLPPAALAMLNDEPEIADLGPLRIVRSITAPLSPIQARRFHERFGVVVLNSYGQTELGGEVVGWSTADVREHGEAKLGSVGRVHDGVQLRTNEDGELEARTPATAEGRVAPDFLDRLTDDGWFRTGDLGRIDADGFVWLDGRVSDVINRGGNKVFPAAVEEVLLAAPGVREVAVVGVHDDRLGEVPWAFYVPAGDPATSAEALDAWCRARLTPYRVPARFVAIDELPRNDIGKVIRAELSARAESLT
jgi:acyl-CoA synthetase (AMP-forming)/AMP-acid ligase II